MFLGVDGGGTKTAFCLLSKDGRVVSEAEAAGCYFLSIGLDRAEAVLAEGVAGICREAGIDPSEIEHAFFGLPAFGEVSSVTERLRAMPAKALGHSRYGVDNDMVCGWAGSLAASDGINVIAGTGSMTYGERQGRGFRCGGWGEVFGDEGSAYWIAVQGLGAFSRMSDGRADKTALHGLLRRELELATDLDLVDTVLNRWESDRSRVAGLAPVVMRAAEAGDAEAGRILDAAASELATLVEVTRSRLGFGADETVPVSYSGGVFRSGPFTQRFRRTLDLVGGTFELRVPLYPPVVGGALYAARLAGHPIRQIDIA